MMTVKKMSTWKILGICLLAFLAFMLSGACSVLFYQGSRLLGIPLISYGLFGFSYVSLALLSIYVLAKRICQFDFEKFGIKLTLPRLSCLAVAVLMPLAVQLGLHLSGGQSYLADDLYKAIIIGGLAAPIAEELFFRGFIMRLLELKYSRTIAILSPSFAFAALHLLNGALNLITALQLLLAGTLVGILFSLATYLTKSIVNSILIHSVWNLIMGTVLFKQQSFLFGGKYGADISPLAILAYAIAIAALFYLSKRGKHQ
ncbi:CPBP family intramembrane glutamic endopeptidase [Streptococcus dentasini]